MKKFFLLNYICIIFYILLFINICQCKPEKYKQRIANSKAFATGLKVSVDDINGESLGDIASGSGSSVAEAGLPFSPFIPFSLFVRAGAKMYLSTQINKVRWMEIYLKHFRPQCNLWTCLYDPKFKIFDRPSKLEIENNDGMYDINKYSRDCNDIIGNKLPKTIEYEKSNKNSYQLLPSPYNKLQHLGKALYDLCKVHVDPYKSKTGAQVSQRGQCFSEQGWFMRKGHLDYHLAAWTSVNQLFNCVRKTVHQKSAKPKSILIKNSKSKSKKKQSTTKTVKFELQDKHQATKKCDFNQLYNKAHDDMNALIKRLLHYSQKKSNPCYKLWDKTKLTFIQ